MMVLNISFVILLLGLKVTAGYQWEILVVIGDDYNAGSPDSFYLDVSGTKEDKTGIELGKDFEAKEEREISVDADFGNVNTIRIYQHSTNGLNVENITLSDGSRHFNFNCNCWIQTDKTSKVSGPSWTLYTTDCYWNESVSHCINITRLTCQTGQCTQCGHGYHLAGNTCTAVRNSVWKPCKVGNDILYKSDIKFNLSVSHNWECAMACAKYGDACLAYSTVLRTKACYGYGSLFIAELVPGAVFWKRMCVLPGYQYVSEWRKCIKIYPDLVTWSQASSACRANGGALLRFDKHEVLLKILSGSVPCIFGASFWVGGRDTGTNIPDDWKWENGEVIHQNYWAPGEPNNTTEKCTVIFNLNEGLLDEDCNVIHGFICQDQGC